MLAGKGTWRAPALRRLHAARTRRGDVRRRWWDTPTTTADPSVAIETPPAYDTETVVTAERDTGLTVAYFPVADAKHGLPSIDLFAPAPDVEGLTTESLFDELVLFLRDQVG